MQRPAVYVGLMLVLLACAVFVVQRVAAADPTPTSPWVPLDYFQFPYSDITDLKAWKWEYLGSPPDQPDNPLGFQAKKTQCSAKYPVASKAAWTGQIPDKCQFDFVSSGAPSDATNEYIAIGRMEIRGRGQKLLRGRLQFDYQLRASGAPDRPWWDAGYWDGTDTPNMAVSWNWRVGNESKQVLTPLLDVGFNTFSGRCSCPDCSDMPKADDARDPDNPCWLHYDSTSFHFEGSSVDPGINVTNGIELVMTIENKRMGVNFKNMHLSLIWTQDPDPCTNLGANATCGPNSVCNSFQPDKLCACLPGFKTDSQVLNQYDCYDIDECQENNGGCSLDPKTKCINLPGSNKCDPCPPHSDGPIYPPQNCTWKDACAGPPFTLGVQCAYLNSYPNGGYFHCVSDRGVGNCDPQCPNLPDFYRVEQYHVTPEVIVPVCHPIDHCTEEYKYCKCPIPDVCQNLPGSCTCTDCPVGTTVISVNGTVKACVDINECKDWTPEQTGCPPPTPLEPHCHNRNRSMLNHSDPNWGTYKCDDCPPGSNGLFDDHCLGTAACRNCIDIDECKENPAICQKELYTYCININSVNASTYGQKYECGCSPFQVKTPSGCKDAGDKYCEQRPNVCLDNGRQCLGMHEGVPSCGDCIPSYYQEFSPRRDCCCEPVNLCDLSVIRSQPQMADVTRVCYQGDSASCKISTNPLTVLCQNGCPRGPNGEPAMVGTGGAPDFCHDLDECRDWQSAGWPTPSAPHFPCQFQLQGHTFNAACANSIFNPNPIRSGERANQDRFSCSCAGLQGVDPKSVYPNCADLNECATNNGNCPDILLLDGKTKITGVCVNDLPVPFGHYYACNNCSMDLAATGKCIPCPDGYDLDGAICRDHDECQDKDSKGVPIHCHPPAPANRSCTNLLKPEKYRCGPCEPSQYVQTPSDPANEGCIDIDECLVNNGNCVAAPGLENIPDIVTCVNRFAQPQLCQCKRGFQPSPPANPIGNCTDLDECLYDSLEVAAGRPTKYCDPLSQCGNTAGGFSCGACPPAYAGNGYRTDPYDGSVKASGCQEGRSTVLKLALACATNPTTWFNSSGSADTFSAALARFWKDSSATQGRTDIFLLYQPPQDGRPVDSKLVKVGSSSVDGYAVSQAVPIDASGTPAQEYYSMLIEYKLVAGGVDVAQSDAIVKAVYKLLYTSLMNVRTGKDKRLELDSVHQVVLDPNVPLMHTCPAGGADTGQWREQCCADSPSACPSDKPLLGTLAIVLIACGGALFVVLIGVMVFLCVRARGKTGGGGLRSFMIDRDAADAAENYNRSFAQSQRNKQKQRSQFHAPTFEMQPCKTTGATDEKW